MQAIRNALQLEALAAFWKLNAENFDTPEQRAEALDRELRAKADRDAIDAGRNRHDRRKAAALAR